MKIVAGRIVMGVRVALAALSVATALGAGAAQAAAPAEVLGMVVARDAILGLDGNARIWRRGLGQLDAWSVVAFTAAGTGARVVDFACAYDGSGKCVVRLDGAKPVAVLYDASTQAQEALKIQIDEVSKFVAANRLYYLDRTPQGQVLRLYDPAARTDVAVGPVEPSEELFYLAIDGEIQPEARFDRGHFRTFGEGAAATRFAVSLNDNYQVSKGRLVLPESWGTNRPIRPGAHAIAVLDLQRPDLTSGQVRVKPGLAVLAPTEPVAAVPNTLRVDVNADMMMQLTGAKARAVGVVCNVSPKVRGYKALLQASPEAYIQVSGGETGPGFVVRTASLLDSGQYRYVALSPSPGGYATRECQDTKVTMVDLGVPSRSLVGEFEQGRGEAVSADGTKVPFMVFKAKGQPPRAILIDVYGAYGQIIGRAPYPPDILAELKRTGAMIVMPMVRGDGNLGYAQAVASKTPDRDKAVQDVIAVTESLAKAYPGLKPVVRGTSAGGWLAVRTAMEQPALFSGVIGYAGAYSLSEQAEMNADARFFDPGDGLTGRLGKLVGACPALKFRFLHAKDDRTVAYADAQAFAERVRAAGCPVEFIGFERGGHGIVLTPGQEADAARRLHGYYDPMP